MTFLSLTENSESQQQKKIEIHQVPLLKEYIGPMIE